MVDVLVDVTAAVVVRLVQTEAEAEARVKVKEAGVKVVQVQQLAAVPLERQVVRRVACSEPMYSSQLSMSLDFFRVGLKDTF